MQRQLGALLDDLGIEDIHARHAGLDIAIELGFFGGTPQRHFRLAASDNLFVIVETRQHLPLLYPVAGLDEDFPDRARRLRHDDDRTDGIAGADRAEAVIDDAADHPLRDDERHILAAPRAAVCSTSLLLAIVALARRNNRHHGFGSASSRNRPATPGTKATAAAIPATSKKNTGKAASRRSCTSPARCVRGDEIASSVL